MSLDTIDIVRADKTSNPASPNPNKADRLSEGANVPPSIISFIKMTIANMKANTPTLNIWSTMLGLSPIALENVPSKKVLIVVNPSDPPTKSARPLEKGFKFVEFITILFSPHEN